MLSCYQGSHTIPPTPSAKAVVMKARVMKAPRIPKDHFKPPFPPGSERRIHSPIPPLGQSTGSIAPFPPGSEHKNQSPIPPLSG